jgi:hypothetical protein
MSLIPNEATLRLMLAKLEQAYPPDSEKLMACATIYLRALVQNMLSQTEPYPPPPPPPVVLSQATPRPPPPHAAVDR